MEPFTPTRCRQNGFILLCLRQRFYRRTRRLELHTHRFGGEHPLVKVYRHDTPDKRGRGPPHSGDFLRLALQPKRAAFAGPPLQPQRALSITLAQHGRDFLRQAARRRIAHTCSIIVEHHFTLIGIKHGTEHRVLVFKRIGHKGFKGI